MLYNSSDRDDKSSVEKGCFNCRFGKFGLMSFYCEEPNKGDKDLHKFSDTCSYWQLKHEEEKITYKYPEYDGD